MNGHRGCGNVTVMLLCVQASWVAVSLSHILAIGSTAHGMGTLNCAAHGSRRYRSPEHGGDSSGLHGRAHCRRSDYGGAHATLCTIP